MDNWPNTYPEELLLNYFYMMIKFGGIWWLPEFYIKDEFRYMWE